MAGSINVTVPNMWGEFYVADPMATNPINLTAFTWDLSNAIHQTPDIQRATEVQSEDINIYGSPNAVTFVKGAKTSFTVTHYVNVSDDEASWYHRCWLAENDPTNPLTKVSFLARGINPADGTPIFQDYFCPEAQISISGGSVTFGAAGELRQFTITFNEQLPAVLIDTVPGIPPESIVTPAP